jgi:hypothetical protein
MFALAWTGTTGVGRREMKAEQTREWVHHQAGRTVICVTLFGARVIKFVNVEDSLSDERGLETFSRLPVPLSCRPTSLKRGEERKPIPVEGIIDSHGVLAYSGIAARTLYRRFAGVAEDLDYRNGGIDGRETLAKLASSIGLERPAEHFYEEYWNEATRLLDSSWEMVERVAEALESHQTLNGNRIDALILGE